MRKSTWLLLPFGLLAAGCPMDGGNGNPEAVLVGEWDATDAAMREFDLVFNEQGVLVQIRGENMAGQPVTIDIDGSTTELEGDNLTIRVPVGEFTGVFTGTLSADENTIEGTLSRSITVGDALEITIAQGAITAVRDMDGDGDEVDEEVLFMASLDGAQETPPVTTEGTGEATITLSADQMQLELALTASNLSGPVTMAHIHFAPAGTAGPIVRDLTALVVEDGNGQVTINAVVDVADFNPPLDVADLISGRLYFNLHTAMHPLGEIRGQILAADDGDDGEGGGPG